MEATFLWKDKLRKRNHEQISIDQKGISADDDESNMAKRQKVKIAPNPIETKIIDINVDCQEAIFQHLTLIDLVNTAEAHGKLVEAAGSVFSRLYKSKTFKINGMRYILGRSDTTHDIKADCIEIHDRDLWSKILQHFGEHIKKMSIDFCGYLSMEYFVRHIQNEVQKYCKSSLIGLEIKNCNDFSIDQTFSKLRELTIRNSVLSFEKMQLFQNLKRLDVSAGMIQLENTANGFFEPITGLEHLAIEVKPKGLTEANVFTLLRLNKQITSLHLTAHLNSRFLQAVSKCAKNLHSLHLCIFSYADGQMVHFDSVEKLKITSNREPYTNLQLTFDRVKEMDLIVNGNTDIGLIEFITRHTQLEKLDIIAPDWNEVMLTDDDLMIISAILSNLGHLILRNCYVSINAALELMENCKSLKKFGFSCDIDYDANTDRAWNVTKSDRFYLYTRK